MPSAILVGRYENVPFDQRLCICGSGEVEDVSHYLLRCPLYDHPRSKFLAGILRTLCDSPPLAQLCMLLAGRDVITTHQVAKFALAAKTIRAKLQKP